MSDARAAKGTAERVGSGAGRVMRAWRGLPPERRLAGFAAIGLFLTLFLPWYQETVLVANGTKLPVATTSLSGWAAFSFVEAAVLLVAAGVLLLLFQRAEGKAFHVPGGDGGVITAAGVWTCVLVVWRIFDKQGTSIRGPGADISGIEWGIFVALGVGAFLAYAGTRIRAAHVPEPPLPGEEPASTLNPGQAPPASPTSRARTRRAVAVEDPPPPTRRRAEAPPTRRARTPAEEPPPRRASPPRPVPPEDLPTRRMGGEEPPTRRHRSTARRAERTVAEDSRSEPVGWDEPATDWIDGEGRRTRRGASSDSGTQATAGENLRTPRTAGPSAGQTGDGPPTPRGAITDSKTQTTAGEDPRTARTAGAPTETRPPAGRNEPGTASAADDDRWTDPDAGQYPPAGYDGDDEDQTEVLGPSTHAARRNRPVDDQLTIPIERQD
jgi:hypothetical protein